MNSPIDSKQRASNHHAADVKDDRFEWHHVYVVGAEQREWKERWPFVANGRSCCGGSVNVGSCKVVDPDDGRAGSMQASSRGSGAGSVDECSFDVAGSRVNQDAEF